MLKQQPSEFASARVVTSSGVTCEFGFIANVIRLSNDAARVSAFVSFRHRAATVADAELKPGETWQLATVRASSVSFVTEGAEARVRVLALGD